jgi:hypothetical protein
LRQVVYEELREDKPAAEVRRAVLWHEDDDKADLRVLGLSRHALHEGGSRDNLAKSAPASLRRQ